MREGGIQLAGVASQSLAVCLCSPSGSECRRTKLRIVDLVLMTNETISLPEAASQSLAVSSALAVRIRAPSGLKAA